MTFGCTAMLVVACGGEGMRTLDLDFTGVDPLSNDYHYEGWAIINGEARSTGKFNLDAAGDFFTVGGVEIPNGEFDVDFDLDDATVIVISIEPAGDTDAIPSDTKFLAGDVVGDDADLTVAATQALGDDFTTSTGKVILATPTNGSGTNELSGIWFLDLGSGSPEVGLSLPTLPTGWKYEGWAVISGQPVTSGKFTAVDMADESAPYSGPQPGPPFPGEDYLENAPAGLVFPTDLSGDIVVISVEPDPDDDTAPFVLKPLVYQLPTPAQDHFTYDMDNQAGMTFPTGTASLK
ncbi:hypothetical protein AMJ83_08160 [candidate division WOR_3 bacterium SM23_42]|uniref:Anti-sigma factor n=1 Tax=candidate division WOR_3 bacterium SM23_42 TaxID=1703779 RepID=A0A0S8FSP8_UNCW3|nr:MAG: hypothetical protein AMJ83_08160 [candidate division WOR_3 bacterium SM23_42]